MRCRPLAALLLALTTCSPGPAAPREPAAVEVPVLDEIPCRDCEPTEHPDVRI